MTALLQFEKNIEIACVNFLKTQEINAYFGRSLETIPKKKR